MQSFQSAGRCMHKQKKLKLTTINYQIENRINNVLSYLKKEKYHETEIDVGSVI